LFKQLLVSLVILVAAAAGYVYFVPGASTTLASIGIKLPMQTAAADSVQPASGAPAAGQRQGTSGPGGRGRAPTVITAPVTVATINDKLTAIGQGAAAHSVTVTSQAIGTLVTLKVSPGDVVKAGDVIAELDADAEQIAYDKATLAAKDAADALKRTEELAKTNAATTVALSTAQLAADTSALELRNAKLSLGKRSIVTPIDGTVGLFQVTAGNAVTAQSVVTTIDDASYILVNYWVPERYASLVKAGQPVTAAAVALPGESFAGTVDAVDSRVDPTSRTLQIEARIPNDKQAIKPGMSFSVSMTFPGQQYEAVDPLAIQWGADGSYVWKYADSKVTKGKVRIIQRNSDGVLVNGDLKPDDQVVTQGVLQLAEGQTVKLLDSPTAPTTAAAPAAAAPAAAPAAATDATSSGQSGHRHRDGPAAAPATTPQS
jgi:RND family efflux transporter MFP subunit